MSKSKKTPTYKYWGGGGGGVQLNKYSLTLGYLAQESYDALVVDDLPFEQIPKAKEIMIIATKVVNICPEQIFPAHKSPLLNPSRPLMDLFRTL